MSPVLPIVSAPPPSGNRQEASRSRTLVLIPRSSRPDGPDGPDGMHGSAGGWLHERGRPRQHRGLPLSDSPRVGCEGGKSETRPIAPDAPMVWDAVGRRVPAAPPTPARPARSSRPCRPLGARDRLGAEPVTPRDRAVELTGRHRAGGAFHEEAFRLPSGGVAVLTRRP